MSPTNSALAFVKAHLALLILLDRTIAHPWKGRWDRCAPFLNALRRHSDAVEQMLFDHGRLTIDEAVRRVDGLVTYWGATVALIRSNGTAYLDLENRRRAIEQMFGPIRATFLHIAEEMEKAKREQVQTESEQLPPRDSRFAEKDVPAVFREGGKPDGKVLTATYLADTPEWDLLGPYLSRNYGRKKTLTTHIKVGRTKAYLFMEVAALRKIKTDNQARREERR